MANYIICDNTGTDIIDMAFTMAVQGNNASEQVANLTTEPTNDFEDVFLALWLAALTLPDYQTAVTIWKYAPPPIIVLGVICNLLNILVMTRPGFRKKLTSCLFVALAVADSLVLLTRANRYWILHMFNLDVRHLSKWGCTLHVFLSYLSAHSASWILVIISWERVLAINFPVKSKMWITKRRGLMLLMATLLVLAVYVGYLSNLFVLQFKPRKNQVDCYINPNAQYFQTYIFPWLELSIYSFIPFIFLISGNVCILIKVINARHDAKLKMNVNQENSTMSTLTSILLTVSFVFIITTLPRTILSVVYIFRLFLYNNNLSAQWKARNSLLNSIVINISYINNGINFWLYCISGPRFRKEFMGLFGKKIIK